MDLHGASAIVTGGASGIGAASARALPERGARCVLIDLNEELGKELAGALGGLFVQADVTDPGEVQAAIDAAGELGPLRALVNSAGIGNAYRTACRRAPPSRWRSSRRSSGSTSSGPSTCCAWRRRPWLLAGATRPRWRPGRASGR